MELEIADEMSGGGFKMAVGDESLTFLSVILRWRVVGRTSASLLPLGLGVRGIFPLSFH